MSIQKITSGAIAGLAGGLLFSGMMGMMGMLPMIGKMVGSPTVAAGLAVHLVNSAIIGAGFSVVLGRFVANRAGGAGYGLAYGAAWWLLGPLTLMPLFMGMGLGANWNLDAAAKMLPSLAGHLMYGLVLGLSFVWIRARLGACGTACRPAEARADRG